MIMGKYFLISREKWYLTKISISTIEYVSLKDHFLRSMLTSAGISGICRPPEPTIIFPPSQITLQNQNIFQILLTVHYSLAIILKGPTFYTILFPIVKPDSHLYAGLILHNPIFTLQKTFFIKSEMLSILRGKIILEEMSKHGDF